MAAIFGLKLWHSASEPVTPSNTNTVASGNAPPKVTGQSLTYWITVQKFKDKKPYQDPFVLPGEINFEADYQIRLNARTVGSGYLYVFNEGPSTASAQPEFILVFPSVTTNKGSSFLTAGQVVQIPEKSWLVFDKDQGVEKLWLVFSEDAVPELETAIQFASPQTKNLITDVTQNKIVQSFLTNPSLPKAEAEKGETLTTVKAAGKLLVYAIKLEHH